MFRLTIEKTSDGYVLREHGYVAASAATGSILTVLVCAVIFSLIGYVETPRERMGCYAVAALLAVPMILTGYNAVTHWGRRLVLDGEGCRLRGVFLREQFIPWTAVKDFGVTHKVVHTSRGIRVSHVYTLYISPTHLSATSEGRVIGRSNRAVTLQIRGTDVEDLRSVGVVDFCDTQINRDREDEGRVKPYIAADRRSED